MDMSQNEQEVLEKIKKLQEETRILKKTIPKRHKPQPLPKSIKDEEFIKVIKNLKNNKSGKESKVAFLLAYESGMRISEIKHLQKEHIDITAKRIMVVRGKFAKDRVVPLPKTWKSWMMDYIPIKRTVRSLERNFKLAGNKSEIRSELVFHSMRHGFATNLLERGMPINQVQLLLGHSSVGTTNVYIRANPTDALKSYEELF
jgi:integrase/recombinase XerD